MVSDPISDALRERAAELRNSIGAQARSMLPVWPGFSPEVIAERRAEREAVAAQQLAAAMVEWSNLRERAQESSASVLLLALLDLHKPYTIFGSAPYCEHCMSGGYDSDSVEWPCETYEIIKSGMMAS